MFAGNVHLPLEQIATQIIAATTKHQPHAWSLHDRAATDNLRHRWLNSGSGCFCICKWTNDQHQHKIEILEVEQNIIYLDTRWSCWWTKRQIGYSPSIVGETIWPQLHFHRKVSGRRGDDKSRKETTFNLDEHWSEANKAGCIDKRNKLMFRFSTDHNMKN
jgi:hypothetical protein